MIDIHCHILPGLDDGPEHLEESLDMARQAFDDGIRTIVATPHTLNQKYSNPVDRVANHVRGFRRELQVAGIEIDVRTGADVHFCGNIVDQIAQKEAGTIDDGGLYLLLEFPHHVVPSGFEHEIFALKLKGITPIITHPERNLYIQNKPEILYDMVGMGCATQITAMSITGDFGEEAMLVAHWMLTQRLGHIIASDAHSAKGRPVKLKEAVEAAAAILGSDAEALAMVTQRPKAVLEGKPISLPEPRHPSDTNRSVWRKMKNFVGRYLG